MKTGLTKKQKASEFYLDEHDDLAKSYTHNTGMKNCLPAYTQAYPELCQLAEDDEQGCLWFEIYKHHVGLRLTVPYSPAERDLQTES